MLAQPSASSESAKGGPFQGVLGFFHVSLARKVPGLPYQFLPVVFASKQPHQTPFSPDNTSFGVRISIRPYPSSKFTALNNRILPRLTICLKFQLTRTSTRPIVASAT